MEDYKNIMTLEDVLKANGKTRRQFNDHTKNNTPHEVMYEILKEWAYALNGGKHMSNNDDSQKKWFPLFWGIGSSRGFAFYCSDYDLDESRIDRYLAVDSREKSDHFAMHAIVYWDLYLNG